MGVISCLSNRKLTNPENHVVVEADPKLLKIISSNSRRNGAKFGVMNAAVGYTHTDNRVQLRKANFANRRGVSNGMNSIRVPVTTLRKVADSKGFSGQISVIYDIEGTEVEMTEVEMVDRELEFFVRVGGFMVEIHSSDDGMAKLLKSKLGSVGLKYTDRRGETLLLERAHSGAAMSMII